LDVGAEFKDITHLGQVLEADSGRRAFTYVLQHTLGN